MPRFKRPRPGGPPRGRARPSAEPRARPPPNASPPWSRRGRGDASRATAWCSPGAGRSASAGPRAPLRRAARRAQGTRPCPRAALEDPHPRLRDGELGVPRRRLGREPVQQGAHGVDAPVEDQADVAVGEHAGGMAPVIGALGVPDRLDRMPVLLVPAGGDPVERRDVRRISAAKLQPQEVGEQVVIAEPRCARIERGDERVCLLQLLKEPVRARASRSEDRRAARSPGPGSPSSTAAPGPQVAGAPTPRPSGTPPPSARCP